MSIVVATTPGAMIPGIVARSAIGIKTLSASMQAPIIGRQRQTPAAITGAMTVRNRAVRALEPRPVVPALIAPVSGSLSVIAPPLRVSVRVLVTRRNALGPADSVPVVAMDRSARVVATAHNALAAQVSGRAMAREFNVRAGARPRSAPQVELNSDRRSDLRVELNSDRRSGLRVGLNSDRRSDLQAERNSARRVAGIAMRSGASIRGDNKLIAAGRVVPRQHGPAVADKRAHEQAAARGRVVVVADVGARAPVADDRRLTTV